MFFTQSVVRHWHRLAREALDAPPLEMIKARLNRFLISLILWMETLPMAEGLQLDGP